MEEAPISLMHAPTSLGWAFRWNTTAVVPALEGRRDTLQSPDMLPKPRPLTVVRAIAHPDLTVPLQSHPARPIPKRVRNSPPSSPKLLGSGCFFEKSCLAKDFKEKDVEVIDVSVNQFSQFRRMFPSPIPEEQKKGKNSLKKKGGAKLSTVELRNSSVPVSQIKKDIQPILSGERASRFPYQLSQETFQPLPDCSFAVQVLSPTNSPSVVAPSPISSPGLSRLHLTNQPPILPTQGSVEKSKVNMVKASRQLLTSSGEVLQKYPHVINCSSPHDQSPHNLFSTPTRNLQNDSDHKSPRSPPKQRSPRDRSRRKSSKRKMNRIGSPCDELSLFVESEAKPLVDKAKTKKGERSRKLKEPTRESNGEWFTSSFATRNMRSWDVVEVTLFLGEIGMEQYQQTFHECGVDGKMLSFIDSTDLEVLGILPLCHRSFILFQRDIYLRSTKELDQKQNCLSRVDEWLIDNEEYLFSASLCDYNS